jgi:hypothetical protein
MKWWQANGFIKHVLALKEIVDTSFVAEAAKSLGD